MGVDVVEILVGLSVDSVGGSEPIAKENPVGEEVLSTLKGAGVTGPLAVFGALVGGQR